MARWAAVKWSRRKSIRAWSWTRPPASGASAEGRPFSVIVIGMSP
jgi:hypothetical protein